MFLGEFDHTLDSKGRLTIPAKFRDQLVTGLVLTRNPIERCLWLMPMAEWERVSAKVSNLPLTDPRSALLRRAFFSGAEDLKLDKQGRILMNQRLRSYAQIDSEVVVAGVSKFIELWNPTLWDEKVLQQLENAELNIALFSALEV